MKSRSIRTASGAAASAAGSELRPRSACPRGALSGEGIRARLDDDLAGPQPAGENLTAPDAVVTARPADLRQQRNAAAHGLADPGGRPGPQLVVRHRAHPTGPARAPAVALACRPLVIVV